MCVTPGVKKCHTTCEKMACVTSGAIKYHTTCEKVLCVTPGIKKWSEHDPTQYNQMLQSIPLRYIGDPEEDIGRVAVFLASDDSKYITGQTFMVDGGSTKVY